jgi:hypothetical protein
MEHLYRPLKKNEKLPNPNPSTAVEFCKNQETFW